ncbi:metallophosphoesterase family protein [Peribacillus huizhouensis]|uniref:Phosphoesterase n=1 Tax=Peribacillus huizhouensis TaxID=1501239 RepID=A0ABR6CMJ7_9BACI|nr:YfcE family phosphodiesterase [Peribacillus huizhouensis]MBA9026245.1 putative phosphoesterase [Peribacillus huizhouensis]
MKLAFISDIHGNAAALDAVLHDIKLRNVDQVYVLGDLCYRGIEPKRALELVRALNCEVIKGNADEWVIRGVGEGEVPNQALEMMNRERDWIVSQLDEECIEYLKERPTELNLTFGDVTIHAFHATPNSLFEVVQTDDSDEVLTEKLMAKQADLYIYAHIHKPYVRCINGKYVINCGSVGLPFDGLKKASYTLIDIEAESIQVSNVRVDYDVESVIRQFKESDYPNHELLANILDNAKL